MLVFFCYISRYYYICVPSTFCKSYRNYIPFCITKKTSSRDAFSFVISSQLGDDPVLKFREGRKEDRSDHFVSATHFKFKTVHRKSYFFWLFQIQQNYFDVPIFFILYLNDFYKKKVTKIHRGRVLRPCSCLYLSILAFSQKKMIIKKMNSVCHISIYVLFNNLSLILTRETSKMFLIYKS